MDLLFRDGTKESKAKLGKEPISAGLIPLESLAPAPAVIVPQGGRLPKAMPIELSNLSYLDTNGKATRIGFKIEKDKKVRIAKSTGDVIDA